MRRLTKFALLGFLGYAVATASPAQQTAIVDGTLAIKDALFEACVRENGLCTSAIQFVGSLVSRSLSDNSAPWMDEEAKRPQSKAVKESAAPPKGFNG